MVAIELVKPGVGDGRTPDPDLTKRIQAEALARKLIVLTAGTYVNVIRIIPPLVTTADEVDMALVDPRRQPGGRGSVEPRDRDRAYRAAMNDPALEAARARVADVARAIEPHRAPGRRRLAARRDDAAGGARPGSARGGQLRARGALLDEAVAAARDQTMRSSRDRGSAARGPQRTWPISVVRAK